MSSVGETLRRPWLRELAVVAALYGAYVLARVFASDDKSLALQNATDLLHLERIVGLDTERSWNALLVTHEWLSTFSAYWYATMHYVVTPLMLYLLWRKSRPLYSRMRWALVGSTVLALTGYLLFPTAPPRMMSGYVDVMAQTAHVGWWGSSASAPQGLGGLTNELAAMPSMHVGWAVWCSLALLVLGNRLWHRAASVIYTLVTTIVVVATANHWLIDAVAGAAIVVFFFGVFLVVPRVRSWQERRSLSLDGQPDSPDGLSTADVELELGESATAERRDAAGV
jgi:hypothetical protein